MNDGEFKMRVLEDLAVIKTMARQTDKDVVQLQKAVFGNGKPGLQKLIFVAFVCIFLLAVDNPLVCKMFSVFTK